MTDKYLLFCGDDFYPSGGWKDFKGYFDEIESAKSFFKEFDPVPSQTWAHIVYKDKIVLYAHMDFNFLKKNEWLWSEKDD